ncbi:hypothetical protein ANO11243_058930 [Dothideomycetidae sp. 11243]|nr:hypothetical protein ANO11243_058930 [fungal sp. No.11243]
MSLSNPLPYPPSHSKLELLPPELLHRITTHLPLLSSLTTLSQTSRSLHTSISTSGLRSFHTLRFPLSTTSLRSDVTTSRNWDRRSLRAGTALPLSSTALVEGSDGFVTPERGRKWSVAKGQTMGFVPALSSRGGPGREVLAVGAGAEILLRTCEVDERSGRRGWTTYRPFGAVEGRDDVTAVQVLGQEDDVEQVIVGTAAGRLDVLNLRTDGDWTVPYEIVHSSLNTERRAVRDLALSPARTHHRDQHDTLISAVLGQDTLALYDLKAAQQGSDLRIPPLSSIDLSDRSTPHSQVWRTKWLSNTAVGATLSSAREPIRVYTLRPTGLSEQPISKIAIHPSQPRTVYPLEPLHATNGCVFASGGYDGVVRLHDVRCSGRRAQYAARDMAEYGPVYSLLSRPGHHLLAGAAQFDLLSVLDLRTKGFLRIPLAEVENRDHETTVINIPADAEVEEVVGLGAAPDGRYDYRAAKGYSVRQSSYNLYLRDRTSRFEGPVYSLSSPSAYSPFVYVGIENSVVQICLDGATDATPDPAVRMALTATAADWVQEKPPARSRKDKRPSSQISGELNLKSADHGSLKVTEQRSVVDAQGRGSIGGPLDERW